jgi:hypothetical protein
VSEINAAYIRLWEIRRARYPVNEVSYSALRRGAVRLDRKAFRFFAPRPEPPVLQGGEKKENAPA